MPPAPMQPAFSVITPVFNKWDLTKACLESLREHTREAPFEVIVVDNASSDATRTELEALGRALFGPHFLRIRFEENRNFGPACNAGAQAATADIVYFLNNDTLATPGWAPPLLESLRNDHSGSDGHAPGAVGPLLLYEDDTVQHLGVALAPSGFTHLYRRFPRDHPVVKRPRQLQAITAAALMISKDFFFTCGGFHEGYVNGFEDVELCLRIREQGKALQCDTRSVVYHLESQTPGRKKEDNHNARILRERCEAYFYVDLHHHGLRDGFAPFVDDVLDISLRLRPQDEAALTEAAADLSPPDLYALSKAHPLWVRGKERLAEALEAQGIFEEALHFRTEIASQLQSAEAFTACLRTAVKARNTGTVHLAEKHLRLIAENEREKEKTLRYVKYVLSHTAGRRDALLHSLYEAKLAAMFNE